MFRSLTKLTLAGSAVYAATSTTYEIDAIGKRFDFNKSKPAITKVSTLEDLELLEKYRGCQFAFVDSWENKTVYNAREFLNVWESKKDRKDWRKFVLEAAKRYESKCQSKAQLTLFFDGKKFITGNPPAPKVVRRK